MHEAQVQSGDDFSASRWQVVLGTALAYGTVGALALLLTGPVGYAAALYPPAGIALAAVLTYGRAAWPGVLLGSWAVNIGLGWLQTGPGWAPTALALAIAGGATLQAVVGAALVQRLAGLPLLLNAPREILRASAGGALLACLISPSVATLALTAAGAVDSDRWMSNWLTWWVGDTLGVLIATPLALTLVGRPQEDWQPRRRTVGVPLLLAMVLLTWATHQFLRLDQERVRIGFERDVDRLASEAQARLRMPVYALQAVHGAALASGTPNATVLREGARWWLRQPMPLQAVGYSERVALADIKTFEAAVRADGQPDFNVFQRDAGQSLAGDGEAVVMRRVEPLAGNASALGVNVLSIPAARAAILAARDSGEPRASAGFALTQSTRGETGMVLYQALFDGTPGDATARAVAFRGVLFVTVRTEPLLADLSALTSAIDWCVTDPDQGAQRRRLAGSGACAAASPRAGPLATRLLEFGGRPLELQATLRPSALPLDLTGGWLLSLTGLAASAMLGALLLIVTGQARRTRLEVQTATAELRREVSDRRQAEAALRQSEGRLRSIVDNVPLGVGFLDAHGALLEGNQRLFTMLGYSPQDLLGRRVAEFTHAEDQAAMQQQHQELLAGRINVARGQLRLRRGDGSHLWVRVAASAQRDDGVRVDHMIAVVEDISEHRRLEAAERAVHRAEEANRAKTEFVSRMSHELRTPLNAMIGFAQLLGLEDQPGLTSQQRNWTVQIQRAGWHLLELINETLDLARIEAGAIQVTLQPVLLAPLLGNCRAMLSGVAAQRGISVDEELAAGAPAVTADPTRLRQVLTNLLSNAVKYNRDGGRVTVRVRRTAEGRVAIEVTDTGIGLSASQLDRLFLPYDRLGREHGSIEGTGIGLVISQRLAELMGGTLEADSRIGEGSCFTLTLDAAQPPEAAPESRFDAADVDHRHHRVLYVEDNPTNVEVMRGMLGQRPQIALEVTTLGLDGLVAARRQPPDLILLDMQLPDISGLELLRMLKNDDDLASIPVIVLSADATPARVQDALTLGAIQYLTKPVDVRRLLESLDAVLEGPSSRWDRSI